MRELFGYWLPWQYESGHVEEHLATRSRVTACDLDYMAECEIVGKDSLAFLQQLCTNDVSALEDGRVRYTTMCGEDGLMVDDGTVWRFSAERYVFVTGDEKDYGWIRQQAEPFEVEVTNLTSDWTTLAVQGPKSRDTVRKLTEVDVDALGYYRFTEGVVAGVDCTIGRLGYTGELGIELHFRPADGQRIWESVMEAGAEQGILPCGQAALESLRQEAGYLLVGNDHDKTTNPLEAGLGWTVAFQKNDFNGKQALEQLLEDGVGRRLVWIRLRDEEELPAGSLVETVQGRSIGAVTSSSYSPTLGRGVAMAYVTVAHAIAGVPIRVRVAQGDARAPEGVVSLMPLYDPGDVRTRAAW